VWVTNDRTSSLTELNAKTGAFIRFVKGKNDGLSVMSSIASNGTDVWVTNLGTSSATGNTVSEFRVSTGALVQVLRGPRYGFSEPYVVTYSSGRVWVANGGTKSLTEFSAG
jgi:hypothetical protein